MFGLSGKEYEARMAQAVAEDRRQKALNYVVELVRSNRLSGLNSDRLLDVAAKVEAYLATGAVPTEETVADMVDDA